jgi:hypothetical protein
MYATLSRVVGYEDYPQSTSTYIRVIHAYQRAAGQADLASNIPMSGGGMKKAVYL